MALTTYDELKSALANWSHRSDITAIADDLILAGEAHIFQNVRTRAMEAELSSTIVGLTAAVPSDYLGLRYAYLETGTRRSPLETSTPDWLAKKYPVASTGVPAYVAVDRSSFVFGPLPDSAYVLKGTYYAKPAPIATAVNAIFTECAPVYLFAALSELEAFTENDPRVALWMAKRDSLIRGMNGNADKERFSGALTRKVG